MLDHPDPASIPVVAAARDGKRPPIRIVLADGHELMRRGLRLSLDGERDMEVVAEARSLTSVARHIEAQRPRVLVLDLGMPNGSSIEAIGELRAQAPETQIVVLTMQDDPAFVQRAFAVGAIGFVVKDRADEELSTAIRAAARGARYVSPRALARLDALRRLRA